MDMIEKIVDCPRCMETCGWCSDYRWMHGKMRLPGTRRYCDIAAMQPDKGDCEMCGGSQKVRAVTRFSMIAAAGKG